MSKQPTLSSDPLVNKIRKLLKSVEPRPIPTQRQRNSFGYWCVVCPDCGELCYEKRGNYNHHWTLVHGTPFWKEQQLIKLIKKELQK